MNAFATGMRKNSSLVAVSSGLLYRMERDKIRAVLAHEVSHIANGDMVTLALIQGVVNTFVIFFSRIVGHTVDRLVFRNERGHGIGFWVTTILAEMWSLSCVKFRLVAASQIIRLNESSIKPVCSI